MLRAFFPPDGLCSHVVYLVSEEAPFHGLDVAGEASADEDETHMPPHLEMLEPRQLLSSQPPLQRQFEFGTRALRLTPGFILIVATHYSPRLGYGWLGNGGIGAADRGRRANPTTRHLNYGRDKTFLVTLANGLYE